MNVVLRRRLGSVVLAAWLGSILLPAADLQAISISPDQLATVTIRVNGSETWTYVPTGDVLEASGGGRGGWRLTVPVVVGNGTGVVIEQLQFEVNPLVSGSFGAMNTTSTTQAFSFSSTLPSVFGAPNTLVGSVDISVTDANGDGVATIATTGMQPIYAAQIDGATIATLQDEPFSLSTMTPGGTANASASFGPIVSAVGVTSSIGFDVQFSLTPGDTATISGVFDVQQQGTVMPLPAGVWGGVGMFMLLATRRPPRTPRTPGPPDPPDPPDPRTPDPRKVGTRAVAMVKVRRRRVAARRAGRDAQQCNKPAPG